MKNSNILVSIITVVFNSKNSIENTILSVLDQSYSNIEYIIIDGGSTDGTLDILKKYENKFSYFLSEPDFGIYDAMNKGITVAKGEWINFMNSGDSFYSKESLSQITNFFTRHINILYGDTLLNFGNDTNFKIKYARDFSQIKYSIPFCHQSVFVRDELIKDTKFDLKYKYSADYNYFLNLFKFKKYNYKKVDMVISIYDMNGVSNGRNALSENYMISSRLFPYNISTLYHFLKLKYYIFKTQFVSILPNNLMLKLKKLRKDNNLTNHYRSQS